MAVNGSVGPARGQHFDRIGEYALEGLDILHHFLCVFALVTLVEVGLIGELFLYFFLQFLGFAFVEEAHSFFFFVEFAVVDLFVFNFRNVED